MKLSAIYFFHIRINPWRDRTHCRLIYAAALSGTVLWFIVALPYCAVDVVPDYTLYNSSSVYPTAAAYTQAEGNLSTSWRHTGGAQAWLHSFLTSIQDGRFTPGKDLWYPMKRGRGGYQSPSRRFGEDRNRLFLPGFQPRAVQPVA